MILAADIGGTNIRAAIVTSDGTITDEMRSRIDLGDRNSSENDLIERISHFFAKIIQGHDNITAVGVGFPGFFIGNSGVLVSSPNLPNLHHVNFAEKLSEHLKIPVKIQNDALCAAIGEHRFGAGSGISNLLHITLGTGVGGGLILNNTPHTGESGMAMEFGHLRVVHNDFARQCGCGGKGCLEAYASATAIKSLYSEATGERLGAREIQKLAHNDDQGALQLFENAGHYLGMSIAEAVKLLDVHTITISGGLTGAWSLFHPTVIESLNENLIPPLKGKINVLKSTLNDNAGLLGAAALTHFSD